MMMHTAAGSGGSQETHKMNFRLIVVSTCLFVAACASPGLHEPSRDIDKPELLSGEAIFGTSTLHPLPDIEDLRADYIRDPDGCAVQEGCSTSHLQAPCILHPEAGVLQTGVAAKER